MRLIDQTHVSVFYVQTQGPQPIFEPGTPEHDAVMRRLQVGDLTVLEDESCFRRVPGANEVEAPEGWSGDTYGLVSDRSLDPSGRWMFATVYSTSVPEPKGRGMNLRRAFRGIWSLDDGRCARLDLLPEDIRDALWTETGLLVLTHPDEGKAGDDYSIRLLAHPEFCETVHASFDASSKSETVSAQCLAALGPAHCIVILADGMGDGAFHVLELCAGAVHRRLCIENPGGSSPEIAISPDSRWVAYRDVATDQYEGGYTLCVASLATGEASTHRVRARDESVEKIAFASDGRLAITLPSRTVHVDVPPSREDITI